MQPQFQQDGGGDLGEGRPAAPGPGFREGGRDLGSIDQTELRAVEGHQPPAAPERLAVRPPRRSRPQRPSQQVGKDLPRQAQAPIRPGTVGQRDAKQLEQVVGQRPGVLHHMERQGRQQLSHWHARCASAAARQGRRPAWTHQRLPCPEESRRAVRLAPSLSLGMSRHPQRKYRFLAKCTRGISPQRISERH